MAREFSLSLIGKVAILAPFLGWGAYGFIRARDRFGPSGIGMQEILSAKKKVTVINPDAEKAAKAPKPPKPARQKHSFWQNLLFFGFVAGVVVFLSATVVVAYLVHEWRQELPAFDSVGEYTPVLGTNLYSADGQHLAEFAIEKRELVSLDQVPKRVVQAFLAAEDRNFFDHNGFDPWHFLRAMIKNVKAGRFKEGASTLTMQLARTFFLTREKKVERKAKEILVSIFVLEKNLSKKDILYLYLNQVYFGHGAYGIQQGAKMYFDKNVWDLSLGEMAVLAGMPKAPGSDSPFVHMERAVSRRNYVLRRMFEEDFISKEEFDQASAEAITLNPPADPFLTTAPDYAEHIRKQLYDTYGEDTLYKGGLYVEAAVDMNYQHAAQDAVFYGLRQMDKREGYRGPAAELTDEAQISSFVASAKARYGKTLSRNRFYWAVVLQAGEKSATLQVGETQAKLLVDNIRWARKPNPDLPWDAIVLKNLTQILKHGDVVLVRPTDAKGIKDRLDYRSEAPLDSATLTLDLWEVPLAQSAVFSKEPETGYVKAMVGGFDFERSEFNRAIQACRQPGSAFKPIVYTAAIDSDWDVSTIILDAPIVAGEWTEQWKPDNYGENFQGEVSLRYALQHSLNIPAIKTIEHVGVPKVKDYAKRMGIRTAIQDDPSIALGSACVTPEDLTNVYSHIATYGLDTPTVFIKLLVDQSGQILIDNRHYTDISLDFGEKLARLGVWAENPPERQFPETTGYIMNWLLTQVVQGGTASEASALGRPAAGKTGTTNEAYDAWFAGYVPNLVTVAWIGHDDNVRPLGKNETGGRAALPIWLDYMKNALKDSPKLDFPGVGGLTWIAVDPQTGKHVAPGGAGISAPFKPGTGPTETMSTAGEVSADTYFKTGDVY